MKFFNRLERKLGRFAIPHLMYYLIALNAVGAVLSYTRPGVFEQYLNLNAEAILHGQVWRIVTFLMQPPGYTSIFWSVIMLYIYYLIGSQLERVMGTFKFNSYIFLGVILHVAAALIAYAITGVSYPIGTNYLYLSFFFIYALAFPNARFLLFFLIPIKGSWIAILDGFYFVWAIIQGFLPQYGGAADIGIYYRAGAIAAAVSLINAVIYYFSLRDDFAATAARYKRRQQEQMKAWAEQLRKKEQQGGWANRPSGPYAGQSAQQAPTAAQAAGVPDSGAVVPRHRCHICGRTELDDPNLEFRYCSKCNGNYEYCSDHLFSHEHVK